jgi:PLD-like domain
MKLAAAFVAIGALSRADPAPTVHYSPAENLEHIDVSLIDGARHEIDFAAYVLTDWPVMQALKRAADRGVKVRIYLDGTQFAEREPTRVFQDLAQTSGVEIRIKRSHGAPMHLNGDSPDRVDAMVFALTELMSGTRTDGIVDFYRSLVEEERERAEAAVPGSAAARAEVATVTFLAPEGLSDVFTMSGRRICIEVDRLVKVSERDAVPLRQAGWQEVERVLLT